MSAFNQEDRNEKIARIRQNKKSSVYRFLSAHCRFSVGSVGRGKPTLILCRPTVCERKQGPLEFLPFGALKTHVVPLWESTLWPDSTIELWLEPLLVFCFCAVTMFIKYNESVIRIKQEKWYIRVMRGVNQVRKRGILVSLCILTRECKRCLIFQNTSCQWTVVLIKMF